MVVVIVLKVKIKLSASHNEIGKRLRSPTSLRSRGSLLNMAIFCIKLRLRI
jgi:hypothetical protein